MGKQHKHKNHKTNTNNTNAAPAPAATHKRNTLALQVRNELKSLNTSLLELGFKQAANPNEEWQQYVEMQKLLTRIMQLEAPLRRSNSNSTAEARLAKIAEFERWAAEQGTRADGLCIAEFPGYELGLQATRDIAEGEQLFSIPRKVMMSEEQLPENFSMPHFGNMSNLKLAYLLTQEMLQPQSYWKPYLDMLPERYNTVLYFSVEQMEMLRGSNALSAALRQCKSIARQYAVIYSCEQQMPTGGITAMGRALKEQFNYELYRWAVSTVMTRQNMIPRSKPAPPITNAQGETIPASDTIAALIPFWDMANHRQGCITTFYNVESQQIESTAQCEFKKGEQIFIHYGDRSNADLMVHNGFIDAQNCRDSVTIKLGLGTTDPLYEQRAQLLQLLQIPKSSELKVLPAPVHISPELLAFVRVFNMNAEQLEHWISSERAMDLLHIDCALETALETKTWQYLQTRLMLLLRVFPSTLEADELQLAAHKCGEQALSYVEAMLLEYRVLEKRILAAALDYAKQRTKA